MQQLPNGFRFTVTDTVGQTDSAQTQDVGNTTTATDTRSDVLLRCQRAHILCSDLVSCGNLRFVSGREEIREVIEGLTPEERTVGAIGLRQIAASHSDSKTGWRLVDRLGRRGPRR